MRSAQGMIAIMVLASAGCGGVSAERVAALEAQLKELQGRAGEGGGASTAALQQKFDESNASSEERFKRMEEMLEVLQRSVTAASAEQQDPQASAADNEWEEIEVLFGIEGTPPKAEGDKYTVSRKWLLRQVKALAASGKGPKLSAAKDAGVTVKAIKPKSLPDLLGIKNNDVILAVAGNEVNTVDELYAAVRAAKSPLDVKISRKKKEVTFNYTLSE